MQSGDTQGALICVHNGHKNYVEAWKNYLGMEMVLVGLIDHFLEQKLISFPPYKIFKATHIFCESGFSSLISFL